MKNKFNINDKTSQKTKNKSNMKSKRISIILLMVAFFASTSNNLIAQTPIQTEWSLNGNSINHGEFIGTVNQQPLRFCTNNNQRGIFSQYSGFFGIGINEPKNPLHIHSTKKRDGFLDFHYDNPAPTVGENKEDKEEEYRHRNSGSMKRSDNGDSIDYSGLQITNAATGANPENGLLMYVSDRRGFLRQMEDELLTIGVQGTDIMNFTPQGNVGIGTDEPFQMLHVMEGNILISKDPNANNRAPGSVNGSMLFGAVVDSENEFGRWGIEYVSDNNAGYGLNFWQPHGQNQSTVNYRLFLADDGNIGIKTNHPQAELSVNGTVLAKAVRVNTSAAYWPDYVFANDYRMMSISELESYVNKHKHLPGIPSASEVEEKGSVDLGEMNTLLLQKVEELTKYIIDLQKQIDELKKGKE